jgi:ketosteroid isomerase-like protein
MADAASAGIAIVKRLYDAAASGAADDMLAVMDDAIRIVLPPALPYGGVYEGKPAVLELGARLAAAWSTFRYEVLRYTTGEDCVIAVIELRSIARATGREVRTPIAEVFQLRNGRVAGIQAFYFDTALAARAFETV